MTSFSEADVPSLLRRLGAVLYDTLLLAALLMLASFLYVPLVDQALVAPFNRALYQLYLLAISMAYFGWFWVHGGQTLGLRTWRLRLVTRDGGAVTWMQAVRHFLAAIVSWLCLGLGFLWVLVDREKLAWHDRFSDTRLILLPKIPRRLPS